MFWIRNFNINLYSISKEFSILDLDIPFIALVTVLVVAMENKLSYIGFYCAPALTQYRTTSLVITTSFNELQIDKAEQRHLNEQLYNSSGLATFLTITIPILSSTMKLLFDRFSKTPNVIKSADVVSTGHRNLILVPYTGSNVRNLLNDNISLYSISKEQSIPPILGFCAAAQIRCYRKMELAKFSRENQNILLGKTISLYCLNYLRDKKYKKYKFGFQKFDVNIYI
ncbi:hypothetical protein PIROE2DRAFT_7820 [Piromyces sp. E2]|nr:hypothetical protein PIROE2DRAFT_7820 [Piromyces sp. E2]|eukprot:OUM65190.1 hypothetical protein PIROE2DRAFT_7820 [Piromyces sp. E2]